MSTTVRRPLVAFMALAAALALMVPIFAGRASAADSTVYVVHGIPGVTVDVYVEGNLALPGFTPGTTSPALTLPAGDYLVEVFGAQAVPPEFASARGDSPVISETETVPSGANVSLVANLAGGTETITPFVNDISAVPEGSSRVTVRHTANAPAVKVLVDGTVAIANLPAGEQASAVLPAGTYDIQVQLLDGTPVAALSPGVTAIPAAKNVIVYAVGSLQGDSLTLVQQVIDVPTTPATPPTPAPPAAAGVAANPAMTG